MDIIPFKGYRYNPQVAGEAGDCIAPPYDVIEPEQQQALYDRNAFNIVRIIKAQADPRDAGGNSAYTRAAEALKDFIDRKALVADDTERIYVYCQDFVIQGTSYRRSGFVALGKLEPYGDRIKPHEQTLAGPKADRLNLTRAICAQVGQIFMLYSEPEKTIDHILTQASQAPALLTHTDDDLVTHQLFAVTDAQDIETIVRVMSEKDIFIADGHHRYETALNYYDETQNPRAANQLMTLVNTHNEGLIVLPTHRLVGNVADFDVARLLEQIRTQFDVARLAFADDVEKREKQQEMFDALALEFKNSEHAFGMYFNDGAFCLATLREAGAMASVAGGHSSAWQTLDVSILHKLILEQHLGIDEAALTAQTHVDYIKDQGDAALRAIDRIDRGDGQALFFMNPTPIEAVEAVAMAGEKMPQKSTFFFPKIFSGLVLNLLG